MVKLTTLALLAVLAAASLAACEGPASDGRYATHDRGRSNNRAEVPASVPVLMGELGR